jgi:hypothetical protein
MPRGVYLLGVGLALLALALAATDGAVRPPFKPGVTAANAQRVRVGMRLGEVEALCGGGGTVGRCKPYGQGAVWLELSWAGPEGVASVGYYFACPRQAGVREVAFRRNSRPGPRAWLRAWLGW